MLEDVLNSRPELSEAELLKIAQNFVEGAAGANAEKTMEQFQGMNDDIQKLAQAINYFDKSVTGEKGTQQIAEALKQQMAGQINDVMQNGFVSPTEKDRDGNPKVYTGQDAVDKFMEVAQENLAKEAKQMQMASWKNYDAAEAKKAAKAQAALNGGIPSQNQNPYAIGSGVLLQNGTPVGNTALVGSGLTHNPYSSMGNAYLAGGGLALGGGMYSINGIDYNQTHDYMSPSQASPAVLYNFLADVTGIGSTILTGLGIAGAVTLNPATPLAFTGATWLGATSMGYRIAAWASEPNDDNAWNAGVSIIATAFDFATMGVGGKTTQAFYNSTMRIENAYLINSERVQLQAYEAMKPNVFGLAYSGISEAYSGISTTYPNYHTSGITNPPYYYQYLNSGGNVNNNNQYGYYSRP